MKQFFSRFVNSSRTEQHRQDRLHIRAGFERAAGLCHVFERMRQQAHERAHRHDPQAMEQRR